MIKAIFLLLIHSWRWDYQSLFKYSFLVIEITAFQFSYHMASSIEGFHMASLDDLNTATLNNPF